MASTRQSYSRIVKRFLLLIFRRVMSNLSPLTAAMRLRARSQQTPIARPNPASPALAPQAPTAIPQARAGARATNRGAQGERLMALKARSQATPTVVRPSTTPNEVVAGGLGRMPGSVFSGGPQGPRMNYSMVPDPSVFAKQSSNTRHFEHRHVSSRWRMDMGEETRLGLVPADWSTTSSMSDPRPNGRQIFDARFSGTPMGRARAGRSMAWDPRGTMNAGGTRAFANIDIVNEMAKKHAAKVAAGTKAAQYAEYYDGVQLKGGGQGGVSYTDMALAQMSQLQRRQLDKDGDGSISSVELKRAGFSNF